MPMKDASSLACPSFSQMFNPPRMFRWHQSFTIGSPWRKGKKTPSSDSEVVLTNMKMISNETNQTKELVQDPPAIPDPSEESGPLDSGPLLQHQASLVTEHDTPVKTEYLVTLSNLSSLTPKGHLPRLAKFESEDSGVELPSGANSPLTPKGSEKSFVLHRRDSSCDSGVLTVSSSPAAGHVIMRMCKGMAGDCVRILESKRPEELCAGQASAAQTPAASLEDVTDGLEGEQPGHCCFGRSQGECLDDKLSEGTDVLSLPTTPAREERHGGDHSQGVLEDRPPRENSLRKYPTSDSLDEYMNECCRLSEVNQGNAKVLGSGLGYLQHICQLIEKIGQLQEHSLRLQKQVGSLQKEQKRIQLKEEYFLQHCSCGAASILFSSYQEVKTFFAGKSRPHSLSVQSGNMSDLSVIPETGGSSGKSSHCRGADVHMGAENNPLTMGSKLSCGRRGENERREGGGVTGGQTFLPEESSMKQGSISRTISGESHAWGRMKDHVRKTRERNQSRLGLPSAAWKRSCPQLYRVEIESYFTSEAAKVLNGLVMNMNGLDELQLSSDRMERLPDTTSLDLTKVERNSMIALGKDSRNESAWPF